MKGFPNVGWNRGTFCLQQYHVAWRSFQSDSFRFKWSITELMQKSIAAVLEIVARIKDELGEEISLPENKLEEISGKLLLRYYRNGQIFEEVIFDECVIVDVR